MKEDQHPLVERPVPNNKLSEAERSRILAICNQPEVPPGQIVPRLADSGQYLAAESTFYRILGEASNEVNSRPPILRQKPIRSGCGTSATCQPLYGVCTTTFIW